MGKESFKDDGYGVFAQARAARSAAQVEEMLEQLAAGETLSEHSPLEGQVRRFRAIMRTYFPKHLKDNSFKILT